VAKLRPYVTALPGPHTLVNANTASPQVLAAMLPELSASEIAELVRAREAKPFRSKDDIAGAAKKATRASLAFLDVKSDFFSVRVRVAQDDVEVAVEALVQRDTAGNAALLWRRAVY
jgi:general secretion pathway protein K